VTGALSVTTAVLDGVSVLHGPAGCAHHNFSLLHSTHLESDRIRSLNLVSTGLGEQEIIFGGEGALESTIRSLAQTDPGVIFVLSTCVAGTIGDDVGAIAGKGWDVPVIHVPSAGFLGGTFQDGFFRALAALADLGECGLPLCGVNIIGEKTLEFEVDEHFREVERLCAGLDLPVNLRFVKDIHAHDIARLGTAEVNILREPDLAPLGEFLKARFGTPYVDSFPCGFDETIRFLRELAAKCGRDASSAIREEQAIQEEILREFSGLHGAAVSFPSAVTDQTVRGAAREIARRTGMTLSPEGTKLPFPSSAPVGTGGTRRLLHRWRRALHG
jgi:nitrogenase molybdenum-iron protein alpha/beta subunit